MAFVRVIVDLEDKNNRNGMAASGAKFRLSLESLFYFTHSLVPIDHLVNFEIQSNCRAGRILPGYVFLV